MAAKARKGRERRTLARPLVQGGVHKAPGETVELRPDQIARLDAQGYFAADGAPAPAGEHDDEETSK